VRSRWKESPKRSAAVLLRLPKPRHSALIIPISCRKEVQHSVSSWKTCTIHGKDSTKDSSNLLHQLAVPPNGPHHSLIGSEPHVLASYLLRQYISVSHRGLCGAGDTTCTLGASSIRRIRHTCVILSLHSSSHKNLGCDDRDGAGQKATIDAVQHETCIGKSITDVS
jgi:hypothetical protein